MITITDHVKQWVTSHPFHAGFLADGLINASALARIIKPEIEKSLGERVSVEAITLALNRHGKSTVNLPTIDYDQYLGEVSVQSNLALLTIPQTDRKEHFLIDTVAKLHEQREFTLFTRGVWHTTLISRRATIDEMEDMFYDATVIKDLAAITIRLKPGHLPVPGVCAYVLQKLAHGGINLAETASSYNELTLIIQQADTNRTLDLFLP